MRSLRESLFDIDNNIDDVDKSVVERFLKDNYDYKHAKFEITPNKNKGKKYIVNARGFVSVTNLSIESFTNELFEWGKVKSFCCSNCNNITSLDDAPKNIEEDFTCRFCLNLTSFDSFPKDCEIDAYGCPIEFTQSVINKIRRDLKNIWKKYSFDDFDWEDGDYKYMDEAWCWGKLRENNYYIEVCDGGSINYRAHEQTIETIQYCGVNIPYSVWKNTFE